MNSLKEIKEQLVIQVQNQMSNLECVNTKELGEVIDMIKDLSKAIYYCEVSKQMEEADESRKLGKGEDLNLLIWEAVKEKLPLPITQQEVLITATTPKEITQYIYAMSAKGAVL